MKKTLLCFLFLFTTVFYAQVSSIIHCAGDNTFDLTSRFNELTKDINPNETITIKYYTKDTYATNDVYALEDPKHFVFNERSLQIYVRINTSGGASIMNSFMIILNSTIEFAYAGISNPACGNTRVTMTARGGKSPYKYSLDGVNYQSEIIFNNVAPGSYDLHIKDDYGCTTSSNLVVDLIQPLTATTLKTDYTCFGSKDGKIQVIPSGGKTPYAYSIDGEPFIITNGSAIGNFSNLLAGPHTIILKDSIGCQMPYTVQILEPQNLVATAFTDNQTVVINASGGTGSYQYSIDGVNYQTSYIFSNLLIGEPYNIKVRDSRGCQTSVPVTVFPPLAVGTQILKPIDCFDNATVTILAAGGKAPYVYAVNKGLYQAANVFTGLVSGTYVFEVKDALNTIRYANVTIAPFENFSMTTAKRDATTNDDNDGTITVTANGGIKPYSYSLLDNNDVVLKYQSSNVFTGLRSGNYSIVANDAGNCSASQTNITILKTPAALFATVDVLPITCSSPTGIVTVAATGGLAPYKYSLDNGSTFVTSNVFNGLASGVYTIRVRDAENNEVQLSAIVYPAITPSLAVTVFTNVHCKGDNTGSVSVAVTGGKAPYVYSINDITFSDAFTFTNLRAGAYNVTVKDANGCLASTAIHISEPAEDLLATAIAVNDQGITVNAKGGTAPYLYSLQNNLGVVIAGPKDNGIFTQLPAGVYTAQVTDAYGCGYMQGGVNVVWAPSFLASAAVTSTACGSLGTITITATGGVGPYTYSLDNGDATISNVFSNLLPGNYTITVRDSQNTTTTLMVAITAKPLAITGTLVTAVTCNGANNGSIKATVLNGEAPYVYKLNNIDFYDSKAEYTFTKLSGGVHTIQVTDKNKCTSFVNIAIPEPTLLNSTVEVNDKTISVNTTGGIPPYLYTLQDHYTGATIRSSQSSNIFDNLPTGTYSVQVIDNSICSLLKTGINITDSDALSVSFSISPINCNTPEGTITVTATGGSGSYQYSLDNGVNYTTSNVFTGLTPGNYLIRVKDSQTTTANLTATISPLNPLSTVAVITKAIDCFSNASINVTASGGKEPYQYSLDDGVTYTSSPLFTNINAGTYFVRVKDAANCTAITNSLILVPPTPLVATVSSTKITDCSTLPISHIEISTTGGKAPYQYSLNNLPYQSNPFYSGAYSGSYTLDVKDSNGCIFTTSFIIESPVSLTATATVIPANNCENNDTVTITATGGQAPYTYSFDGLNTFSAINSSQNLTPGTYMLHVKDSSGCFATLSITIATRSLPVSIISKTNTTTASGNNGSITINTSGGVAPYNYSLFNIKNGTLLPAQNSNTFNNLAPATYSVIVKDAKGCSSVQQQVTILAPPALLATAAVFRPTCFNAGIIIITASGGSGNYQYSIDNGVTYVSSNYFPELQPGNYTIVVRDSQNETYASNLTILPLNPLITTANVVSEVSCVSNGTIAVTATGGKAPYLYSINGSPNQNTNMFTGLIPGDYNITVKDANECIQTIVIKLAPIVPIAASVNIENQNVTVTTTGGSGTYQFSLDGISFQSGNIFTIVNFGTYQIYIRDQNGCTESVYFTVDPPAPLIDGEKTITIPFKSGQTLADLVIEGQNIKWYSSKGTSNSKTSKTLETPLPLTTVIVDGITYYASQTINGIESTERLAVTAKINGALSTSDFVLPNFKFYPNPVLHNITISNTAVIDEIEIYSASGRTVLSKKIDNDHSEIDLSTVSSGLYFLKVKSEGKTKTIKIVKK